MICVLSTVHEQSFQHAPAERTPHPYNAKETASAKKQRGACLHLLTYMRITANANTVCTMVATSGNAYIHTTANVDVAGVSSIIQVHFRPHKSSARAALQQSYLEWQRPRVVARCCRSRAACATQLCATVRRYLKNRGNL
jgi:hypothetical protein